MKKNTPNKVFRDITDTRQCKLRVDTALSLSPQPERASRICIGEGFIDLENVR